VYATPRIMTKHEVPVETAAEKHGPWYWSDTQTAAEKHGPWYRSNTQTAEEKHGPWYRSNTQTITLKPNGVGRTLTHSGPMRWALAANQVRHSTDANLS
jgi:hypothetical protein